jgi:hypothetical protein
MVLLEWAWSYLTYSRGARLITGEAQTPGAALRPVGIPASSS